MQLEERVKTHWQDYLRQGIHQGMQQGRQEGKLEERNRILTLLKRGYTPEQLETLLAQDVNPTKSSPKA